MRQTWTGTRCAGFVACVSCAALLLGATAQDGEAVDGYGPWKFGMRHFQVARFQELGPYIPVEDTGGLETHNGSFAGEPAEISFVFGDYGLDAVRIVVYEGDDVEAMVAALHRVYTHLSERYGDVAMDGGQLGTGLSAAQVAARIPDEYTLPLTSGSPEGESPRDNARARAQRIVVEPVQQPAGARISAHVDRRPRLGTTNVTLIYSRVGIDDGVVASDGALEATTDPVEVVDTAGYLAARLFGSDEYARRSGDEALLDHFADLRTDPEARFLRLSLGATRATMAIVGNFGSGFELRAVPPAVEEPVELRFARDGDRFVLTAGLIAREQGPGDTVHYPVLLRLALHPQDGGDRVRIYALGMRRGTVQIGERELEFAVTGDFGIFNGWYDTVYFDLDGNGAFSRTRNSSELLHVYEGYFTLDGVNWRFDVERFGDRIWLTPLEDDGYRPRAALDVGALAPDFGFVDGDGVQRRLSDYRGSIVLLDFWGAWCGPCRGEAPHLVEAYERYHDAGFEIIGIDYKDSPEDQRAFMQEYGVTWPQARESESDRPIHDLYRNWTWPTHYLIDEEGRILEFNPRGRSVLELLEAHFGR